jgi:hypothetical protein
MKKIVEIKVLIDKKKGEDTLVVPETDITIERKHEFKFNEAFASEEAIDLIELGYFFAKEGYELKIKQEKVI